MQPKYYLVNQFILVGVLNKRHSVVANVLDDSTWVDDAFCDDDSINIVAEPSLTYLSQEFAYSIPMQ